MATVLIQHGEEGPDGTPPPRAYFQLIQGKLHMPTICNYFRLTNIKLDGIVYPTGPDGFTFSTFAPNTTIRVTGDPLPGGRITRILLIRTNEVYGDAEQPGGKRKVMQVEENLGLWTLPSPESQPRTLAELSAAIRTFLQIEHSITWLFKYRYFSELVPIVSDSALAEAFDHFRAMSENEATASQQCRLYLNTTSEELAPRDLIRARISGILDAAAATSASRESAAAAAAASAIPQPPLPSLPSLTSPAMHLPAENAAAAAVALLGSHSPHSAAAAAAALAAAGYGQYLGLQTQSSEIAPQDGGGTYGNGGGENDGDDGEEGDYPGEPGMLSGLLGIQRQSGSEGAGCPGGGGMGQGPPKKESKTRHADGRFKNEVQHQKKMADMGRKITELFDGMIVDLVEVADHKKIMCKVCSHACTAYSAYHTDCVRKHFLRHHETTLRERGVDVARWRKEYEVSQKVKRQQQQQQHEQQAVIPGLPPGMGVTLASQGMTLPAGILINGLNGLNGFNGLSGLSTITIGGSESDVAQRGLPAGILTLGLPADLQLPVVTQQGVTGAANGGGGAVGGALPLQTVSALLLQAQAMQHDEQLQIQAGTISGLITSASVASTSNGPPPGASGPSLVSQLSGALGGSSGGAAVALAPMVRMASGTVTTEMPLPPPMPAQGGSGGGGGGDSLLHEVSSLHLTRSASVASQGPGALPSIRSPPVVTTDMSQPST